MKALVTGSGGFVGGHLVRHLLARGYDVSCLVRADSPPDSLGGLAVTRVRGDYFEPGSLRRAVAGMDQVFHAGAVLSARDWPGYFRANVQGTGNLLEACAQANPGLRKFVYVSSISAVGPAPNKKPLVETDICRPVSLYGKSKFMAEQAARGFFARLPIVIMRPANVLGSGQKELVAVMKLLRRRIVPLIGGRERRTSICFAADLVRALAMAAENEASCGKTYFVAAAESHSWHEILARLLLEMDRRAVLKIPQPFLMAIALVSEALAALTGSAPRLARSDLRSARDNDWLCDPGLIGRELGFQTEVEFAKGIRNIVREFNARTGSW